MARVVVVGGGAAGLRACLAAAEGGAEVVLVSKGVAGASGCTQAIDSRIEFSVVNWPLFEPDTPSTYAADLETVGRGLKNPARVRLFAERSADEVRLLERLGVPLTAGRRIQLAGSTHARGLVCPPRFGRLVSDALRRATPSSRVRVLDRHTALEILIEAGTATGVVVLDARTGVLTVLPADAVVLAAGGAGRLFSLTTNPREICGDGYALAARAGAALDHMEFIQYVMLVVAPIRGYFLLTSVLLRGALVDEAGARLDPRADPDRLSPVEQKQLLTESMRWIADRKRAAPALRVFWEGAAVSEGVIARRMPKTCEAFERRGCDLTRQPVELDLGAHQFLGGVVTDLDARSTVPNLFAAGDVADSVQGADRINGSGIMEALVFGGLAGVAAADAATHSGTPSLPGAYRRRSPFGVPYLAAARRRLAEGMDPLLVVRDRPRLEALETRLTHYLDALEEDGLVAATPAATVALHELRSALTTAVVVTRASLVRERDLGLFMTSPSA